MIKRQKARSDPFMFIYEEAKKYFQIDEHATGWDRMALNTKAIFQEKRTRN